MEPHSEAAEFGGLDEAVLRVFRGGPDGGRPLDYTVPVRPVSIRCRSTSRLPCHR